jgi:hypothetical protein
MGLHFTLWITAFLVLQAQVAWAEIDVSPGKHVLTGSNINVTWKRGENDPTEFYLGMRMHGNNLLTEDPTPVITNNKTKGMVPLSFNQPGKFHLLALNHEYTANTTKNRAKPSNSSIIVQTPPFQVHLAPKSSSSDSSAMHTQSSSPSSKVQVPVIIAVCLGVVLFAVIFLLLVYLALRRRHRKPSPLNPDDRYAFTYSSAQSPTPSRSWLSRKFRNGREDGLSTIDMTTRNTSENNSWPDSINFYHTPRTPPKAVVKKTGVVSGTSVSNGTDTSLSSMRFAAKTERQMEIEERIEELKGKLALLQRSIQAPVGRQDSRMLINMRHNMRIGKWRNQIEKLQELTGSDWALGRTDIIPRGLYGPESVV